MNPNLPLISVVVPSFNQGQFLEKTLNSIFTQNYPKLEVLIMDGGSTDNSLEIIRSYSNRVKYWQSQADGGQASAINAGIKRCEGDLVAWLNSDDFYLDNCFWKVADAYASSPYAGLYIGNGFRYNEKEGQFIPFSKKHTTFNREALKFGLDYILQPSAFFSREAWGRVGGLNPNLNFCMDWDVLIRIGEKYSVVLIHDFLSASREYQETKTSSGRMERACEIIRMVHNSTSQELTLGSAHYLLETLINIVTENNLDFLVAPFIDSLKIIHNCFLERYGSNDGFPESSDNDVVDHLPIPRSDFDYPTPNCTCKLPLISIIVPSFNQSSFLDKALESIILQKYPNVEIIVIDGGSSDSSVDIIKSYQKHIYYWQSKRDSGPADAINQGFSIATGDILGWLSSDDLLASSALWEVAMTFMADCSLDLLFGNALYIDENNELLFADHGTYKTGLYYGRFESYETHHKYWDYVYSVPQPTVFFRRSLMEAAGRLNLAYHFIFDFELFSRYLKVANIKKIERVQAFYRIHSNSKTTSWSCFLEELYAYSRPKWPTVISKDFWFTLKSFLKKYQLPITRRKEKFSIKYWLIISIIAISIVFRVGNPESIRRKIST